MADRTDKIEAAIKKLAIDASAHRSETKALAKHSEARFGDLTESLKDLTESVRDIQRTQLALTNAMTGAIKQLAVDKSLELRMQRVEEAVFGPKH